MASAMRSGALSAAAHHVAIAPFDAALPMLTPESAKTLGLKPMDIAAITYITTAYNTANPHNIIAVRLLMSVLATDQASGRAGVGSGSPVPTVQFPALPPLVQLEDMPPALARRLKCLRIANDDGSRGIVPTLYRHLAHWPDYLMVSAEALEPLFRSGEIEVAASNITHEADAAAARLYGELAAHDSMAGRPSGAAREALLVTLSAFAATIPEMIAVGRLMMNSLLHENREHLFR